MFPIHPLSLSSLAAHHAAIHTVASHLQALCFVWSLFCFPWISLQGAELTDLSDWCIGGRLVSYCFPRQHSVASLTSLICPSYVDTDVGFSFLYQDLLLSRFLELSFIVVCWIFVLLAGVLLCPLQLFFGWLSQLPNHNSHDSMQVEYSP